MKNTKPKKRIEEGTCPKCKKSDLSYGSIELQGESVAYPYKCNDCGFEGQEFYFLEFDYHMDRDGIIY